MSAPSLMTEIRDALSAFWGVRNEREKKQIVLAATVAVIGLVYLFLIEPAYLGRVQLQKSLPALRQQAVEMEALSNEAKALAGITPPPVPDMTKEGIEALLTRAGAKPQSVTLTGDFAKLQFSSVSFASLASALDELKRNARISVVDANINALPQQDVVNAAFTLRQQKND